MPATAVVFVLAPLSFDRRSGVDDATVLSTATATPPLDSVFVALGRGRVPTQSASRDASSISLVRYYSRPRWSRPVWRSVRHWRGLVRLSDRV
ncbi:hypothetical protein BRC90_01605 [Halobacteriales archaeon QS_4_69_34]|nr:MAG: hypothetical protein BRC90_01605 [Halobacteriales archaeon QS_4_69_34]